MTNAIDNERIEDKNDSQMSKFRHSDRTQKIIDELNTMYGNTREKILELVESLKQDKRKDHEIKKILLTEIKFMSRASIYNALPQELKREYTKPLPKEKTIDEQKSTEPEPRDQVITQTKENITNQNYIALTEAEEPSPEELEEIKNKNRIDFPEPDPPPPPINQTKIDEYFNELPDDDGMTCWKHNNISGSALKNRISAWQGNSNLKFRVWIQEIRI